MKIKSLLFAAALALPVFASAQAPDYEKSTAPGSTTDAPDQKTPTKPPPATAANAKLSNDEVMIISHVHRVNVMEVDMGKQAKIKGTDAVKRYGEMLVQDHSSSDKELIAMAKKKGLAKIPAEKPQTEAEKQAMKETREKMAGIARLEGADFDRAYVQAMVEGHEKELAMSDELIAKATDPDLETFLEARKSTLRRHAQTAKELQQSDAQASAMPRPAR